MMKNPTVYLGCDAHKSVSVCCALDDAGTTLWEGRVPSSRDGFALVRRRLDGGDVRIVVEASGFVWPLVDVLSELEFRVFVCNPVRNPSIGFSRKKTDVEDARKLAELLRVGYLSCIYLPTPAERALRSLGRERQSLVRSRVRLMSQSRSATYSHQVERRKRLIAAFRAEEKELNREIAIQAAGNSDIQLLQTAPGIGEYGATLIAGEVCAIDRFPACKQYLAYCGVVPSVRQSGATVRMGATRKDSNSRLRWIYVQAAWHAIRRDPDLNSIFQRKAKAKGKKKSIIVIARKLATRTYWMLKEKKTYQELATTEKIIGNTKPCY